MPLVLKQEPPHLGVALGDVLLVYLPGADGIVEIFCIGRETSVTARREIMLIIIQIRTIRT